MKFKPLKQLHRLRGLIKKEAVDKELSQIALLNHATSVGLYAMRVLHDEIIVPNKAEILAMTMAQIKKLSTMLSKNNNEDTITRKEAKETFKKIRLKPKHIKTS